MRIGAAALLAGATLVAGCTTTQGPNEQAGMIIGGALGGLLGSEVAHGDGRTAAIILGTLAGAAVGGNVGRSMDDTDRLKTALALENVRTGVSTTWRNPDTANEFAMTPTRTYQTASGPCREFTLQGRISGNLEDLRGTACRQRDGSWMIQ